MSEARDQILSRIRGALRDVAAEERPDDVTVAREYRRELTSECGRLLDLLRERLEEYGAECRIVPRSGLAGAVAAACSELGVNRLAIPPDLPSAWHPHGVELVTDEALTTRDLDHVDGVLTGCAVAIAETGTLVLDGRGVSGRRVLTLVPDHHICVVDADQVVAIVPEALTRVASSVHDHGSPVTFISGPSATSDIELNRVAGVHGPRKLWVVIVEH